MKRSAIPYGAAAALVVVALALGRHSSAAPKPWGRSSPSAPRPAARGDGRGSVTMTAHLSDPLLAVGASRSEYAMVDLVGAEVAQSAEDRAPVNIAVVLDCSGSMSGEKLDHARSAAHALVDQLSPSDRLAFVTFGTGVRTLIPSTPCFPDAKARMHGLLDQLSDMGGTNISAGLQDGLAEVRAHAGDYAVNRVILISDGLANQGVTSKYGLVQISRAARESKVSVTSLGVGVDFDEDLMEQLAENGGGNYGFLRTGGDLHAVFQRELTQLSTLVASSAALTVHLGPGVKLEEVYGYALQADEKGNPVIPLYDLPAHAHFRVLMRLTVEASAPGSTPLVDVRLDYTDLLRDRAATQDTQALRAEVTDDAQQAAARRDRALYQQIVIGNAAALSKEVAALYASGQTVAAQQDLAEARRRIGQQIADFGAQSSQAEVDRMLPAAPLPSSFSSEAGRVQAIQMHRHIVDFASQSQAGS